MPGALSHSPADVIRRLLIQLGVGVAPGSSPWPVFITNEPDEPDNCITVYDTTGRGQGRVQITGEKDGHYGFQVRIRSSTSEVGYVKANAIAEALDRQVNRDVVTIGSSQYCIHAVSGRGDILPLGNESPVSERSLFTLNALTYLLELE